MRSGAVQHGYWFSFGVHALVQSCADVRRATTTWVSWYFVGMANSNVSSGCDWIDIVEVPLDDPGSASQIGIEPLVGGTLGSNNGCHDMGIILGDVNLAACASGHATNVFDIGDNDIRHH